MSNKTIRYILILRGINVGGKRKLPMAELRELLSNLGYTDIQTYIQSGNAILSSSDNVDQIAIDVADAIKNKYDYDVPTIAIATDDWIKAAAANPYIADGETDIDRLHLTVLSESPTEDQLEIAHTYDYPPDRYIISERYVYIYCADKYHKSKLTNNHWESKLKVKATTRNWKTVKKLAAMASE